MNYTNNQITLIDDVRFTALLRHDNGASIAELMALTKSNAMQVRTSLRQIIDHGGEVEVMHRNEDGQQTFHLVE